MPPVISLPVLPKTVRRPWCGLIVALLLLLVFESYLHTDAFLVRYRSVFAAGRALDKVRFAETHCPSIIVLGNSRVDNGFDPRAIQHGLELPDGREVFNLGVPGADSRVLGGILDRLDTAGCLRADRVGHLVLSLDEALVQMIDTLGQDVFFINPSRMWTDGQYQDAFRAVLRLYGYSTNLRQLREPASLQRFLAATTANIDSIGGGSALHLGYRAGWGGLQDREAAMRQDAGSLAPPDPVNLRQLWRMLDLLRSRGVHVVVVYPPLLNRDVLYLSANTSEGAPYRAIAAELQRRGVPQIPLDAGAPRDPAEFVNAGHLNDFGAQRYSRLLANSLRQIWGDDLPQRRRNELRPESP